MKLNVWLDNGLVGCRRKATIDVPDADLEDLDENDRQEVFAEYASEWRDKIVELGWAPTEEG